MLSKAQLKAAAGCAAGFLLGVSTMFLLLRVGWSYRAFLEATPGIGSLMGPAPGAAFSNGDGGHYAGAAAHLRRAAAADATAMDGDALVLGGVFHRYQALLAHSSGDVQAVLADGGRISTAGSSVAASSAGAAQQQPGHQGLLPIQRARKLLQGSTLVQGGQFSPVSTAAVPPPPPPPPPFRILPLPVPAPQPLSVPTANLPTTFPPTGALAMPFATAPTAAPSAASVATPEITAAPTPVPTASAAPAPAAAATPAPTGAPTLLPVAAAAQTAAPVAAAPAPMAVVTPAPVKTPAPTASPIRAARALPKVPATPAPTQPVFGAGVPVQPPPPPPAKGSSPADVALMTGPRAALNGFPPSPPLAPPSTARAPYAPIAAPAGACATPWDIVTGNPQLSSFAGYIAANSLQGPFQETNASITLLAPVNDAFTVAAFAPAFYGCTNLTCLLNVHPEVGRSLIAYDVIPASVTSGMLTPGATFNTTAAISLTPITVSVAQPNPTTGAVVLAGKGSTANVLQADIQACGPAAAPSYVHVVDSVLLPFMPSMVPGAGGVAAGTAYSASGAAAPAAEPAAAAPVAAAIAAPMAAAALPAAGGRR